MIVLLILVAAILALLIVYYTYCIVVRFMKVFKPELTKKNKYMCIFLSILIGLPAINMFSTYSMIVLHFIVITALIDLVLFIYNKFINKNGEHGRVYKGFIRLFKIGVISAVISIAFLIYGYVNINNIIETKYTIETDKLSNGIRILQISDLHMGTTLDTLGLQEVCNEMQEKSPDIIVLTGDIFDERTSKSDMENTCKIFGSMNAEYGIYYIFGNHDGGAYGGSKEFKVADIEENMKDNGIIVLKDEVIEVSDEFYIAGRLDYSSKERAKTSEILKDIDKSKFILMLDHQPEGFDEGEVEGVDLQLSGHTHGGQIFPLGLFLTHNYGYFEEGDFKAIVSSGIGGWGYKIRTGHHCEYVVIDIK